MLKASRALWVYAAAAFMAGILLRLGTAAYFSASPMHSQHARPPIVLRITVPNFPAHETTAPVSSGGSVHRRTIDSKAKSSSTALTASASIISLAASEIYKRLTAVAQPNLWAGTY
jgi:hypothetical protein